MEKEDYISKEISKLAQFVKYIIELVFYGNMTEAEEKINHFLAENEDMAFLSQELKNREDFIIFITANEISLWKLQFYSEVLFIRSEILLEKGSKEEGIKSLNYSIYLLECLTLMDQTYDPQREAKIKNYKAKLIASLG